MKLDKFQFANLIAYLCSACGANIDCTSINILDGMIDVEVDAGKPVYASAGQIEDMLAAMNTDRKIEAIKAHRAMTGFGLKESKDLIEKYWQCKPSMSAKDLQKRMLKNIDDYMTTALKPSGHGLEQFAANQVDAIYNFIESFSTGE